MPRKRPGQIKTTEVEAETEVETPEVEAETEDTGKNSVKVQAVFNRMRNPHTATVFPKGISVDIIDLDAAENHWLRSQIRAKVIKLV